MLLVRIRKEVGGLIAVSMLLSTLHGVNLKELIKT